MTGDRAAVLDVWYVLTRRDVFLAMSEAMRVSTLVPLFAAVGSFGAAWLVVAGDLQWTWWIPFWVVLVSGVGSGAVAAARSPYGAEFRRQIDDTWVVTSTQDRESRRQWSAVRAVRQLPSSIVFGDEYGDDFIIPRRALSPDATAALIAIAGRHTHWERPRTWVGPIVGVLAGVVAFGAFTVVYNLVAA